MLFSTVAGKRCAVLLGPPGSGKTTQIAAFAGASGGRCAVVNLGAKPDVASEKISRALRNLSDQAPSWLVLDSLDEARLTTRELLEFLNERVMQRLPPKTRLMLACRTAAWRPAIETQLLEYFDSVAVFDISPLSTEQIRAYATARGLDGKLFLKSLARNQSMPLASTPLTLDLLIEHVKVNDNYSFPRTRIELYERSCERLATEWDDARRHDNEPPPPQEILAAAGHLATAGIFTGRTTFAPGSEPETDDALGIHSITPVRVPHPILSSLATEVSAALAKSTLETSLFTSSPDGGLTFIHQNIAEFLAARHLQRLQLTKVQVESLLRGRGGRLAPQVQAVASWLISMAPQEYFELLRAEPAAFIQSSGELDQQYQRGLFKALLRLAQNFELDGAWGLELEGIQYPEMASDILGVLEDTGSSFDAILVCLRAVRQNAMTSLSSSVTDLALDAERSVHLRSTAANTVLDLGVDSDVAKLAALCHSHIADEDEDEELLGAGLRALLLAKAPLSDVLERILLDRESDLVGNYDMVLFRDLPDRMLDPKVPSRDIEAALRWAIAKDPALSDVTQRRPDSSLERLLDSILEAGLKRVTRRTAELTASLIHTRIRNRHEVAYTHNFVAPEMKQADRRKVLESLFRLSGTLSEIWPIRRFGLLTADDLPWTLELSQTDGVEVARTASWIQAAALPPNDTAAHVLSPFIDRHPEYAESLSFFTQPQPEVPELQPDDAKHAEVEDGPGAEAIRHRLGTTLRRRSAKTFHDVCHWLQFDGRKSRILISPELDIRKFPGWALLTEAQRERVHVLALRYLEKASTDVSKNIGTDTYSSGELAGARALILLTREGREPLLPKERWDFWAPVVAHGPVYTANESLIDNATASVSRHALHALLQACERQMLGQPEMAQFVLRRIARHLPRKAWPWLSQIVGSRAQGPAVVEVALTRMFEIDAGRSEEFAAVLLGQESHPYPPAESLAEIVAVCLARATQRLWSPTIARLQADRELAERVLMDLSYSRENFIGALSESQLSALWILMDRLFPREEDPVVRGAHAISKRESAGELRDRLLPVLADRGTLAAVGEMRELVRQRKGDPNLHRLLARAESSLARQDWRPVSVDELLVVLSGDQRLLRSADDLLAAVLEILDRFEIEALGEASLATLLWNHAGECRGHCRPKSENEISDFLQYEIRRRLPRLVVNREVQVKRYIPNSLPHRADILVETHPAGDDEGSLRLVIEVKGCWNSSIPRALRRQLVDDYLSTWKDAAGLFLVAWFDPSHGSRGSGWRGSHDRGSREALSSTLALAAADARTETGRSVEYLVIDLSMTARPGPPTS